MTFEEINEIVKSFGMPSAYYQFDANGDDQQLPFVVFYFPNSDNFSADNIVWKNIEQLNIEFYSANKDFAKEKEIEDILNENGLFWDKSESYIDSENMYEVLYQMEIAIS